MIQKIKRNIVGIGVGLLIAERIYYYAFQRPELYKWLDYIIEQILAITR